MTVLVRGRVTEQRDVDMCERKRTWGDVLNSQKTTSNQKRARVLGGLKRYLRSSGFQELGG